VSLGHQLASEVVRVGAVHRARVVEDRLDVTADQLGGTNYDAGFTLGNQQNPNATSRIFLSDGGPSTDSDLHRTPPIKTYVVGLGVGNDVTAVQELTQVASDTGGPPPIFIEDAGQLQAAAGAITARQNCKALLMFTDTFSSVGQTRSHAFKAKGRPPTS
jgi:hypothetical protein